VIFELPVRPEPFFTFSTTLDLKQVNLTFRWNVTLQQWFFDLDSPELDEAVHGVPVVTGVDLLAPYAIRELGQLWVIDGRDLGQDPDFDDFGGRWTLMFVDLDGVG
jgi:hypothetical protein